MRQISRTKNIGNLLMNSITVMLFMVCAGMAVLRFEGFMVFSVQSNSMQPVFSKGDAVVARQSKTPPRVGDIVVYADPAQAGVLITHRVIAIRNKTLTTKGDNNVTPDEPVPEDTILAIEQGSLPGFGYVLDQLKHPLGLAVLIYVPSAAIVYSEVSRLKRSFAGQLPGRYNLYGF